MTEYLISFNDEWVPDFDADEILEKGRAVRAVIDEMRTAGAFVYGNGALDASTAICSVDIKDGQPVFSDGPYVESKEHLGGFLVMQASDDETARHWAGRIAVALEWPQEIHRFPNSSPGDEPTA